MFRFIPSVAVEVRTGALGYAEQELDEAAAALEPQVLELFGRLGRVVPLPESLIDVAMGLMSTSPAMFAVIVEALTDAGIRHGMPHDTAAALVADAMAGTAALLEARDHDTLALRRVGDLAGRGHRARRWPRSTGRACAPRCTTRWTRCSRRACDDACWRSTRADIANYVDAVFLVYSLIIIAYIIVSLVLSLGGAAAVLARLRRGAHVPARRLRALPAHLPPLHPVDRRVRLLARSSPCSCSGCCGGIIVIR